MSVIVIAYSEASAAAPCVTWTAGGADKFSPRACRVRIGARRASDSFPWKLFLIGFIVSREPKKRAALTREL